MLERIAPSSILVDESHRAIHLSDTAGCYLQPSGGAATLRAPVDGEVVEDDDVAAREGGGELGLDPGVEGGAVDRPVEHPRGDEAVMAQAGDEGLAVGVAERRVVDDPDPAPGAAAAPGHVGLGAALVDEDQPLRLRLHPRLPLPRWRGSAAMMRSVSAVVRNRTA